jgi:hypothetical protein
MYASFLSKQSAMIAVMCSSAAVAASWRYGENFLWV